MFDITSKNSESPVLAPGTRHLEVISTEGTRQLEGMAVGACKKAGKAAESLQSSLANTSAAYAQVYVVVFQAWLVSTPNLNYCRQRRKMGSLYNR